MPQSIVYVLGKLNILICLFKSKCKFIKLGNVYFRLTFELLNSLDTLRLKNRGVLGYKV